MFPERPALVFERIQLADLHNVADTCLKEAKGEKVWLFYGEMGAGKTTFIKSLCTVLGVIDGMSSPTFSIINEYQGNDGDRLFHFDFFRIKSEAEAYDIGAEDYFYSGNFCFVEWPEKIPGLIPPDHVRVKIDQVDEKYRTIALSVHDGQEKNRI
jgi:tRNA threonylcarbamoyladenosine biosynthesis protein TsaE